MTDQAQSPAGVRLRPQSSLGRRLAFVLLPLVLVPVVLIGGTGYLRSRDILAGQAEDQMLSAASSQVTRLLDWARAREQRLQLGSTGSSLREPLAHLIHDNPVGGQRQAYVDSILIVLQSLQTSEGQVMFSHLAVVDPATGEIVASTNNNWIGENLEGGLLEEVAMDATETRAVYDNPVFSPGGLVMVSSAPMRTGMMESIDAVLLGVNLETRVGALMEELQAFWQQRGVFREVTGETFLAVTPDIIVRLPRYSIAPEAQSGSGHPVFGLALAENQGATEWENLAGLPVLGAYEFVPEMQMGVVVEVPTETIFAELNDLFPFIATIVAITTVLTLLIAVFATSRMLRPLGRLAEFAQRISRGEWDYRIPIARHDEIGVVGHSLNRMAEELRQSYSTLEQRVQERTQQVRTASEVARAVTSIPSLEDLLHKAVELIRERFGYYYVSIFLIDRERKHAELRQATGEIGEALIARKHKLGVGSNSIIGWVTANNSPRIASDVSEDPVHFRNELLTETRSEAAVPLQVGGLVLGALDVQSTEPEAFSDEDIQVLQTLADQLSAAIQNARLAQTSVAAAERARLISDVTGQLSGLLDVDQVLNTAAHSLHRALGDSEIMIKLTVPEAGDGNGRG